MNGPNIAQRINAAMAEVEYIQKQKPKSGMQYSYVSHDAVTGRVRPILQKHGVVYYPRNLIVAQNGNRTEAVFDVRFENMDDRADFIDVSTFGYGVDPQDKGPGKAMSYGVKYALLKVLGLETGDDPEEVQDGRADYRPANDEPPAQGAPAARAKLDGPHTSKTALKNAVHTIRSKVEKAKDNDEIDAIMREACETVKQAAKDWPELLNGDPNIPEDIGLKGYVANRREEVRADPTYDMFIAAMRENHSPRELAAWVATQEAWLDSLSDEQRRRFDREIDAYEAGLQQAAQVKAG